MKAKPSASKARQRVLQSPLLAKGGAHQKSQKTLRQHARTALRQWCRQDDAPSPALAVVWGMVLA